MLIGVVDLGFLRARDVSADAGPAGHRFYFTGGGVHPLDATWVRQPCARLASACSTPRCWWRCPNSAGKQLLATLLVFRVLYFLIPFVTAISIMGARELWLNVVLPWQERRKLNEACHGPTVSASRSGGGRATRPVKKR